MILALEVMMLELKTAPVWARKNATPRANQAISMSLISISEKMPALLAGAGAGVV